MLQNQTFTTLTDFIFAGFISITLLQMISGIYMKKAWWDIDITAINIVRAFSIVYIAFYLLDLNKLYFGIGFEQTPLGNRTFCFYTILENQLLC